jgi:hypothetical protein
VAWQDAEEHFRIFHTHHRGGSPLVRINLPVSITTRNTKWKSTSDMVLLRVFLPSLLRTIEPGYQYGVYLGYDEGDPLLDQPGAESEVRAHWTSICQRHNKSVALKLFRYNDTAHHNVWAVNYITKEAYLDGYDYFFRVNDDSEFQAPGWTSQLVEALQRTEDFGGAGVLDPANPRLWTHSFVGRPHLEIFGFHFPFSFGNYWSDDWITSAYTRRFSIWLYAVPIKHHLHQERYRINWKDADKRLQVELDRAKIRWSRWLCRVKGLAEFCDREARDFVKPVRADKPRGYSRKRYMAMEKEAKQKQFARLANVTA